MDYTKLFYWLTVADNARTLFGWIIGVFMAIFIIALIAHFVIAFSDGYSSGATGDAERSKDLKGARKYMFLSAPFLVIFWMLLVMTPSKKDSLLIIAGGQTLNYLTTDSTAKAIPHELTDFVVTEIRSMAKEAKVELDVSTTKERMIEEAKSMTSDELLKKMAEDANFKQIILENLQ